jgi:hypothetical protein
MKDCRMSSSWVLLARRAWMILLNTLDNSFLALHTCSAPQRLTPIHSMEIPNTTDPFQTPWMAMHSTMHHGRHHLAIMHCGVRWRNTTKQWTRSKSALVSTPVRRDGEVWEDDGDGQHAQVQVVEQIRHLVEHVLAHFPPWTASSSTSVHQQQSRSGQHRCTATEVRCFEMGRAGGVSGGTPASMRTHQRPGGRQDDQL